MFLNYQKAFDRVKHDKLVQVMKKAGVPELEKRLIINLYWRQNAAVKWDGGVSRDVKVRQGGIVSPRLFNLYSEYMMMEAMEGLAGVKFGKNNIMNIRYADNAV